MSQNNKITLAGIKISKVSTVHLPFLLNSQSVKLC